MGFQEDLENAMQAFDEEQTRKGDSDYTEAYLANSDEKERQKELLQTFESLNNPKLNNFLQQPHVQAHLDKLGTHRTTKKTIRGLAIVTFNIARSERRMANH